MRALHIINGAATRVGGSAVFAVELCRALQDSGVDCTLLATDQTTVPDHATAPRATRADLPAAAEGLDVRLFEVPRGHRIVFSPGLARAAREEARRADVVHIHGLRLYPHWAGGRAAQAAHKPYVVTLHGTLDPWMRLQNPGRKRLADTLWQTRHLERASAIHVLTEVEARNVADIAAAVPRVVVPAGLTDPPPADASAVSAFRERMGATEAAPLITFVGRVAEKKGVDVLIESLAILRATGWPHARLVIVGQDDEGLTAGLLEQAARLRLTDAVSFTGPLFGAELWAAVRAADVWALPSQTENFGVAVLEACAAGLPVVCSAGVGVAEAAQLAGACVIAERTADGFASAIARILDDRAYADALRAAGPRFAQHYSWPSVAGAMREAYTRVMA